MEGGAQALFGGGQHLFLVTVDQLGLVRDCLGAASAPFGFGQLKAERCSSARGMTLA